MINFLKKGLQRTFAQTSKIKQNKKIDKEILEEILLEADVAYEIVEEILYYLPPSNLVNKDDLKRVLLTYFLYENKDLSDDTPFVELIIGVNGAGKTTTTAKLANFYKKQNKSVMLGACDTFRAGAIEQLKLWAKKLEIPIIASSQGHDPAAVAYDAVNSAIAKKIDHLLIDTAGRLQNRQNLANELDKIVRLCARAKNEAPHRKILVLDGTQGRAAYSQVVAFNEMVKLDGIIITKLDGTPKGGALFSVARDLELPILYIGVGESMDDLIEFNPQNFVDELIAGIYGEK